MNQLRSTCLEAVDSTVWHCSRINTFAYECTQVNNNNNDNNVLNTRKGPICYTGVKCWVEYVLEDDILEVGKDDADTLKKQTHKLQLQLWTFDAVSAIIDTVQRETQMYLSNNTIHLCLTISR